MISNFALQISSRLRSLAFGLLLFLVLFLHPQQGSAQVASPAFDDANKLFDAGKFSEAITAYENLKKSGMVSAALYYNLGNAYYKSGQMGRAIAAYRQAARLTPRDPDVRANLQFARKQVQGQTQSFSRWQQFLNRLTLNEWTLLAAALCWLFLLLLALRQWRPAWKTSLRNYLVLLFIAAGLSGVCLASAHSQNRPGQLAVVIAREVTAHNGPLSDSPRKYTVYDGAELLVLDQKDDWLQVSVAPGRIGWLLRADVIVL